MSSARLLKTQTQLTDRGLNMTQLTCDRQIPDIQTFE